MTGGGGGAITDVFHHEPARAGAGEPEPEPVRGQAGVPSADGRRQQAAVSVPDPGVFGYGPETTPRL